MSSRRSSPRFTRSEEPLPAEAQGQTSRGHEFPDGPQPAAEEPVSTQPDSEISGNASVDLAEERSSKRSDDDDAPGGATENPDFLLEFPDELPGESGVGTEDVESDPDELEPEPRPRFQREIDLLPPGGKPSRRNITQPLFSGAVDPDGFDSGVRQWWREFEAQVADAQMLDGHRWTDGAKRSILSNSLTGDAAAWFRTLRNQRTDLTFELAGRLLIRQFKSQLPEEDLRQRLANETKRRSETYQEYSLRLLNMADSLPGGAADDSNARAALSSFIAHAYPKMSGVLKQQRYNMSSNVPTTQKLQKLVNYLAYLAASDGKLEARSSGDKRARGTDSRPIPRAHAMVAVVERKKKPQAGQKRLPTPPPRGANRLESIQCHTCRGWGHKAAVCPSKPQQTVAQRLQVNAAAALQQTSDNQA